MKIIDLLNKIANDEEIPKRIKIKNLEYERHWSCYCGDEPICDLYIAVSNNNFKTLKDFSLDCEIEVLEEKKIPEKLEYYDDSIAWVIDNVGQLSDVDKVIIDKLNDVIDYLKSKGE